MKRRRDSTKRSSTGRDTGRTDVSVAFQAHEAFFVPDEHARIRRAMRLMAGAASIHLHRSVLEGERSPLITVALEAAGFIGIYSSNRLRKKASVGIVAIDARHRAFRQAVLERLLELSPRRLVA